MGFLKPIRHLIQPPYDGAVRLGQSMLSFVARTRDRRGNVSLSLRTSRRYKAMFADSLPSNAWLSYEMRPSRLQHAIISAFDRVVGGARTQRTRRSQSGSSPASSRRHRRPEAPMRFATRLLPLLAALCSPAQAAGYE